MQLDVPEILKVALVDDWEAVTKNNQVRYLFILFERWTDHVNKLAFIGRPASQKPYRSRNPGKLQKPRIF
jgi:hypothetical protein